MAAFLMRSASMLAFVTTAGFAVSAAAVDRNIDPKKRCEELVAFYDRYGVTRNESTDGVHNHFRIRADIECQRGHYDVGITGMEVLLLRKKFDIPLNVGPGPWFEPSGKVPVKDSLKGEGRGE